MMIGGGFGSYATYGVDNAGNSTTGAAASTNTGGFAGYGSYGGNNDGGDGGANGGGDGQTFGRRTGEQTIQALSLADVRAVTSDESNRLELNGHEISMVCIVGRVAEVERTSNFTRVSLDDGKDKMEVRIWDLNDDVGGEGGGGSGVAPAGVDEIQEGAYVRFFGNIRTFKGINNVVAISFKIVENPKEIEYHNLLVRFTSLYMKHGPLTDSSTASGDNKPNVGTASGGFGTTGNDDLNPIQRSVLSVVQKYQSTMAGASIDDIVSSLRSTHSESDIRANIGHLYSEGHIYSTVDEDHYKSASFN